MAFNMHLKNTDTAVTHGVIESIKQKKHGLTYCGRRKNGIYAMCGDLSYNNLLHLFGLGLDKYLKYVEIQYQTHSVVTDSHLENQLFTAAVESTVLCLCVVVLYLLLSPAK